MSTNPKPLALDALHRSLGARMGPFAGYMMPIQYPTGLKTEHLQTRASAGLFDVSHMGQLRVRARDGREATLLASLERALPVDFDGWRPGEQRYSLLLNDRGGIEDDLMVVRWVDDHSTEVRIVVNASNRAGDLAWFAARCPDLEVEVIDAALIALQGPQAESVLSSLDPGAASMSFMQARMLRLDGTECLATRSGYTGEDGYEISIPLDAAEKIVERLLADPGVRPVGLGARDTLRLEAGLPLHGNDIGPSISPIEAGLAFAIAPSRRAQGSKAGGFPGADTILEQLASGARRRRVGLISDEPLPIRADAEIVDRDGFPLGRVTSGTVSPTLEQPVMLALVEREAFEQTDQASMYARVRQNRPAVRVAKLPFVPKRYKRAGGA
jgi:aminomethyltransferase